MSATEVISLAVISLTPAAFRARYYISRGGKNGYQRFQGPLKTALILVSQASTQWSLSANRRRPRRIKGWSARHPTGDLLHGGAPKCDCAVGARSDPTAITCVLPPRKRARTFDPSARALPGSVAYPVHSLGSWRAECAPTASRKLEDTEFAALAAHKVAHATTMTAITEIARAIRFISSGSKPESGRTGRAKTYREAERRPARLEPGFWGKGSGWLQHS